MHSWFPTPSVSVTCASWSYSDTFLPTETRHILPNILQKEFSRLMFPQTCSGAENWIRLDFAGNERGERMNRLLDYAIVQLKPVSWSIFSRLLKRLGILEPRRSHKMFLKCWLYRFLWMLPSLKFMSSFSWVCIFLLWFAIPCALALYANLFSVTNRQVYSPLIKDSQK